VIPTEYIAAAPEPKRSELAELDALIRRTVPSFEPFMAGKMIGYGKYHYRYESGHEGDSCRIGLAGNKTGISVYVACVDDGGWLAEQWKDRLGKADVGKSCIRFRHLSDINLGALTKVLRIAHKLRAPGEVDAAASPKRDAGERASSKKPAAKKLAAKKLAAKKPAAKKLAAKKPAAKKLAAKKAKSANK
jgi:hypothetical protein